MIEHFRFTPVRQVKKPVNACHNNLVQHDCLEFRIRVFVVSQPQGVGSGVAFRNLRSHGKTFLRESDFHTLVSVVTYTGICVWHINISSTTPPPPLLFHFRSITRCPSLPPPPPPTCYSFVVQFCVSFWFSLTPGTLGYLDSVVDNELVVSEIIIMTL